MKAPWHWWNWLYDHYPRQTLAAIALLVAMSAAASVVNNLAINHANAERTADNTANAITSCENANESRAASAALWNYVLNLIEAGNPDATPSEKAFVGEFRTYIAKVYQAHDCGNLAEKYPLPPPPTIPAS